MWIVAGVPGEGIDDLLVFRLGSRIGLTLDFGLLFQLTCVMCRAAYHSVHVLFCLACKDHGLGVDVWCSLVDFRTCG